MSVCLGSKIDQAMGPRGMEGIWLQFSSQALDYFSALKQKRVSNVHDNSAGLHCLHCWVVTVFKIWSQSSELKAGPAQVRFASSLGFFFFTTYSRFCLQALTHAWHDSRHIRFLPTQGRYSLPLGTAGETLASDAASCAAALIHPPFLLPLPSHLTLQSEGGVGSHDSFSLPLPISLYRAREGWGAMTPSLSLFSPHLTE